MNARRAHSTGSVGKRHGLGIGVAAILAGTAGSFSTRSMGPSVPHSYGVAAGTAPDTDLKK